ncbi:hypothetical protein DSM104443_00645 [Usitatibacter rugosus]|uniref:Chalcone isomerase domain-containing protein n=2 Tax=Usitatibacter rugosus TaxID=2732067 RepID=A0A6M4GR86_9PROT|nr:hypothetical protein DSM104443_00645 [Usitatibacter rugosus]
MTLPLPLSAFICVYLRRMLFAVVFSTSVASAAPPLPAQVNQEFPGLKELGEGRLRFLAIHVYDSSLWVRGPGFVPTEPFALEIRYAISIKGKALTERSLKEMRGLGYTDEAKLKRWEGEMDRVFPDLRPGDRIVGVHVPGKETRFYSADKFLGAVEDPEFARAFFGIWLDEKTSEPKLRAKMLAVER